MLWFASSFGFFAQPRRDVGLSFSKSEIANRFELTCRVGWFCIHILLNSQVLAMSTALMSLIQETVHLAQLYTTLLSVISDFLSFL